MRVHPQELLALVPHTDQATEAGVLGFQQSLDLAQGRALATDSLAVLRPLDAPAPIQSPTFAPRR